MLKKLWERIIYTEYEDDIDNEILTRRKEHIKSRIDAYNRELHNDTNDSKGENEISTETLLMLSKCLDNQSNFISNQSSILKPNPAISDITLDLLLLAQKTKKKQMVTFGDIIYIESNWKEGLFDSDDEEWIESPNEYSPKLTTTPKVSTTKNDIDDTLMESPEVSVLLKIIDGSWYPVSSDDSDSSDTTLENDEELQSVPEHSLKDSICFSDSKYCEGIQYFPPMPSLNESFYIPKKAMALLGINELDIPFHSHSLPRDTTF
jgi:hypothetical protein